MPFLLVLFPSTMTNEAKNPNSLSFAHKELKCIQYLDCGLNDEALFLGFEHVGTLNIFYPQNVI